MAPACESGATTSERSPGRPSCGPAAICAIAEVTACWLSDAPLGRPVVPPVNRRSSSVVPGCAGAAARPAAHSSSRPTTGMAGSATPSKPGPRTRSMAAASATTWSHSATALRGLSGTSTTPARDAAM